MNVKQVAQRLNLSEHTIRYYDREGLMPFLTKDENGRRIFTEADICLLELIVCLRESHMPLADIRQYIAYQRADDDTTQLRRTILFKHRAFIEQQIRSLEHSLCSIDYKLEHCAACGCQPCAAPDAESCC